MLDRQRRFAEEPLDALTVDRGGLHHPNGRARASAPQTMAERLNGVTAENADASLRRTGSEGGIQRPNALGYTFSSRPTHLA